jgi:large subunit ribosomal protein L23
MALFKKNLIKHKTVKKTGGRADVLPAKNSSLLVKGIRITEKATFLQSQNQYIFEVDGRITKPEIKKAVEKMYKVNVIRVNTINSPAKPKHFGRHIHMAVGLSKAIVTLKTGQKIETGI